MANNPLISQGTLNRIRANVLFPSFPQLNVTASFLGKAGITMALEGDTTTFINTLTGAVTSPDPYQTVNTTINLLKTQSLASLYKAQMETSALVGDIIVRPDSSILPDYSFTNCAIQSLRELNFNGEDAGFVIVVHGYYIINNSLWNLM